VTPQLLGDLSPGADGSGVGEFVSAGDSVFFIANQTQLWKTDGTVAGTVQVKDFGPGVGPTGFYLHDHNGTLVIARNDLGADPWPSDDDNVQFWKSDGTTEGTVLVKDFSVGSRLAMSVGAYFTTVGDTLFAVLDGNEGSGGELWKSNLTESGTVLVKDIEPGSAGSYPSPASSYPGALCSFNGELFFAASDSTHGRELWKSDGTEAGTVLVKDIAPGSDGYGYGPSWLTSVDGQLYFATDDGVHGTELWKSDGTEAGTVLVKDIRPGPEGSWPRGSATDSYSGPFDLEGFNGGVVFFADDGTHGDELWKSDGTEGGTTLVMDIRPGEEGASIFSLQNHNGTLFFNADDGVHGQELWKSDGTTAGTALLRDITPGAGSSAPYWISSADGLLFFNADDGIHGQELWRSDGTWTGTVLASDIRPGSVGSGPFGGTYEQGKLFFSADDGTHGHEPFALDVFAQVLDFGDAPDSYTTLLASDGARHIAGGPTLGTQRDVEQDAAAPLDGRGDDTTDTGSVDDEDGVGFHFLMAGQWQAAATVVVSNAPDGAKLDAWIDFDGNGVWDEPAERIADSFAVADGVNLVTFDVPSAAGVGTTYARFRLSTAGNLGPSGEALDGEIEDHRIEIQELVPTLALTLETDTILENGGSTQATVRRNTGTTGDLAVAIANSDSSEAAVPTNVTIPDGSDSATFVITAVDDLVVDGEQTTTVTVSATGYQSDSDTLDVMDDEVTGQAFAFAESVARVNMSVLGLFDVWYPIEPLFLMGNTEVQVSFEGPDGSALDDDGDGLDEIATELVSMELTGGTTTTGPVTVRLADASVGEIRERGDSNTGGLDLPPYAPGDGDSFYDVFLEIDTIAGPLVHPDPARMSATIHRTPAGMNDTFHLTNGPVLLYERDYPDEPPWIRIDSIDFVADAELGSVQGQKWHDLNANGLRDDGEPGLDGWVVALVAGGEFLMEAAVTDSVDLDGDGAIDPMTERGLYWFDDVPPGDYVLVELGQAGWGRTVPAAYPPTPPALPGPGPNWIEQTIPGEENLSMYARADFDWDLDGDVDESVYMEGMVNVNLGNPEDPGTGDLDRIPAEITFLDFSGQTEDGRSLWVSAGDLNTSYQGGIESLGEFRERADAPTLVESFFDVFFEMDIAEGGAMLIEQPVTERVHNAPDSPLTIGSTLDRFGVDGVLWESQGGVDLMDAIGAVRGRLVSFGTVYHDLPASGFGPAYQITVESGQDLEGLDFGNIDLGPLQFGTDFGDAPAPYPTLGSENGAFHVIQPETFGAFMGLFVDPEADGQPTPTALGDDAAGTPFPDDEDGVILPDVLRLGESAEVIVQASTLGYLNGWLDFNADGDWDDPGEHVFSDRQLAMGENRLSLNVPLLGEGGAATPATYARFRFTSDDPQGQLSYVGPWADGEVEDYAVAIDHPPLTATANPWSIEVVPTSILPESDQVGLTAWEVDTARLGTVDHMQQQWFAYRVGESGPELPLQSLPLTNAATTTAILPNDMIQLSYGGSTDLFVVDIDYLVTSNGELESEILESVTITNQSGDVLELHWFEYTDLDIDPSFGDNTAELLGVGHTRQTSSIGSTVDVEVIAGPNPDHWEIADRDPLFGKLNDPWSDNLADGTSPFGPTNVAQAFQWDFSIGDGQSVTIMKSKGGHVQEVSLPGERVVIIGPRWFDPAIAVGYDYQSSDLSFGTVTLPVGYGDDEYELRLPDGVGGFNDQPIATLNGGQAYDLTQHDANGFTTIRILGIETGPPDEQIPADPADPLAFPTQFAFVGGGETTVEMDGIPETIYVDEYGVFLEEVNNGAAAGVVEAGDQVTWMSGDPNEVTGLIFGDSAFDSLAQAQGYVAARDLAGLTTIAEAPAAEIHGYKFRDLDGNGVMDGDDTRMSGVRVRLLDGNGVLLDEMQTNANGEYAFTGLGPGDYRLTEGSPGFAPTTTFPLDFALSAGEVLVGVSGLAGSLDPNQTETVNGDLIIGNRPTWRNSLDPHNVNNSSPDGVTPLDVLVLIQYINANPGENALPIPPDAAPPYYDVNGDGLVVEQAMIIGHCVIFSSA